VADPKISSALEQAASALAALRENAGALSAIESAADLLAKALRSGNKAVSCGNGGSMCDAMHFAEELTGRYRDDRPAYAAVAISDPSHLSCVANDFGFEFVFSRFIEAHGRAGDVLLAISTSGTSKNVLNAARAARERQMTVVALTGKDDCALGTLADVHIATPGGGYSDRVQELHIKVVHIMIELVEARLA
jgi:D-sedoheptulose 7-phosphate isomerase